jgi:hypothetical protein
LAKAVVVGVTVAVAAVVLLLAGLVEMPARGAVLQLLLAGLEMLSRCAAVVLVAAGIA